MLWRSHLMTDMLGSIAGITYTKNRYGNVGRARTVPVDPASMFQELTRSLFNQSVFGFQQLTEGEQIAWNVFAAGTPWTNKLGEDVRLTGQAMYIAQRCAAIYANPANSPDNFDAAPCTPGLMPLPAVTYGCCVNPVVGAIVSVQNLDSTLNMDFIVRISPAQNQSKVYYNGPYRAPLQILLPAVAAGASDDAEFCPLCIGRYFFQIRGFSAVARNNMTSLTRGHFDVCTDPV